MGGGSTLVLGPRREKSMRRRLERERRRDRWTLVQSRYLRLRSGGATSVPESGRDLIRSLDGEEELVGGEWCRRHHDPETAMG